MKKQDRKRHVPMRTCIVTRQKFPKNELIRLVRNTEGEVKVDKTGKLSGRGASITMDVEVFDQAIKRKSLKHALKLDKALTKEQSEKLRQEFVAFVDEKKLRPKYNQPIKIRVSKDKFLEATGQDTVSGK